MIRTELKNTVSMLTNKAITEIINSHRRTVVKLSIPAFLAPEIALDKTILVDTTRLKAKGKIRAIRRIFEIDTAKAVLEIELAISSLRGTGTVENFGTSYEVTESTAINNSNVVSTGPIDLLNHYYGINPNPDEYTNGYIGNSSDPNDANPTEFRITTPAIDATETDENIEEINLDFRIKIPEDYLEIL